ncbi:MAG: glycosyltransferase family 2 protein [Bacteroidales bacterium]
MTELVSVVMPVHNAEKYIDVAIQSVIAQTYTNWELIVVNDGSTDGSEKIIRQYASADARILLINMESPSGTPTKPRNEGMKRAHGRYIAFLDSDDAWFPNKLTEQIPLFRDEQTAIVYTNYEKMSESGLRHNRIVVAPQTADYERLLTGNVIGNLTGIYDTAKTGKRLCRNVHHEDYVLWLSILKEGFIARNTNTIGGLYRVRDNSVSSSKWKLLPWQWHIYIEIEKTGYLRAMYYYACYALQAIRKRLI